ncbi:MAG: Lrp/AsnC family transcriptional regulator [Anaerolineaceae bacterium]|nr:Lrp/AsnC family transcriptional regulator [Anaerolineaceae bacterium]
MSLENQKLLDQVGWQIISALQQDARLSFAELGRRIGLSLPAVAERVRRLEEAGIITGYRAEIDPGKIGLTMTVFIRLSTTGSQYPALIELIQQLPEVMECHHLTGADSFIMKVVVGSIAHLEKLITRLSTFGPTTTSIVLSSPLKRRALTKGLAEAGESS